MTVVIIHAYYCYELTVTEDWKKLQNE